MLIYWYVLDLICKVGNRLVWGYVVAESGAGVIKVEVCVICHEGNQISSYIVRIIKWCSKGVNLVQWWSLSNSARVVDIINPIGTSFWICRYLNALMKLERLVVDNSVSVASVDIISVSSLSIDEEL